MAAPRLQQQMDAGAVPVGVCLLFRVFRICFFCPALQGAEISLDYLSSAAFSPVCSTAHYLAGTAAQPATALLNKQSFSMSVYLKVYRLVVTQKRNPL